MRYAHSDSAARAYIQSAFSTALYATLLVIVALRYIWGLYDYDPLGVLVSAGVLVALSAVCLSVARVATTRWLMRSVLILQPLIGIAGVSALVHYSGGIYSSFVFLYSVPVLSSVWVSSVFALFTALCSIFSLGALLGAELSGLLPAVTKSGYHASQVVVIHMSRLILLLTVVLGACLAYIKYLTRKQNAYAELQNEVLYALAQEVPAPLAETILSRIEKPTPLVENRSLLSNLTCSSCKASIGSGQNYWALDAETEPAQLGAYRNDIHCTTCHTGTNCDICAAYTTSVREALS